MSVQFERWRLEAGEFAELCTHPDAKTIVYYCSDNDPELKWRKAQPWCKARVFALIVPGNAFEGMKENNKPPTVHHENENLDAARCCRVF